LIHSMIMAKLRRKTIWIAKHSSQPTDPVGARWIMDSWITMERPIARSILLEIWNFQRRISRIIRIESKEVIERLALGMWTKKDHLVSANVDQRPPTHPFIFDPPNEASQAFSRHISAFAVKIVVMLIQQNYHYASVSKHSEDISWIYGCLVSRPSCCRTIIDWVSYAENLVLRKIFFDLIGYISQKNTNYRENYKGIVF
jgi:hypothetical protein